MAMPDDASQFRHVRIHVHGRVQGVGYRASARTEAQRLGLDITAHNLDDGSVQIEAEGPTDAVRKFIDWTRTGPSYAHVESVDVDDEPSRGFA
jgi:acylphosphatase